MSGSSLIAVGILARRELTRFLRQPARLAAGIGTPLMLLAFLGSGVGEAFRPAALEGSYASFVLPGMMMLTLMSSCLRSSIIASVIPRSPNLLALYPVPPANVFLPAREPMLTKK